MKITIDPASPWGKRIFFEDSEFTKMTHDLLISTGQLTIVPGKGIDVDLILMQEFQIDPDFVNLGTGVLGKACFFRSGDVRIEISRELEEESHLSDTSRHRLRATIAHECGHLLCHKQLFASNPDQRDLFLENADVEPVHIVCRAGYLEQSVTYSGEWWEYQANQCMARLLMPHDQVNYWFRKILSSYGVKSMKEAIWKGIDDQVVRELSATFDVSRIAMIYRLRELSIQSDPNQFELQPS